MARHFPNSRFHAFDISKEAIKTAKDSICPCSKTSYKVDNLTFSVDNACSMPKECSGRFSLVLCWDVIHDIPTAGLALSEIARVLAPRGKVSIIEPCMSTYVGDNIDRPFASFYYGVSLFHCMSVSLHAEGMGLGAGWGRQSAEKMFDDAGMKPIEVRERFEHNHFTLTHR